MFRLCGLLVAVALALSGRCQAQLLEGFTTITDGDTITVAGQTVRLHGIDSPEDEQPCRHRGRTHDCGAATTKMLEQIIGPEQWVRCERLDRDRYGLIIGRCFTHGGTDIGAQQVRMSAAFAFIRYNRRARARGPGSWPWLAPL